MDCSVCHEALWGNKNQGLECNGKYNLLKTVCKEVCHRNCMTLIDMSCREVMNLKNVPNLVRFFDINASILWRMIQRIDPDGYIV